MYLTEADGVALLRRVVEHFPSGELQFDAFSRSGIRAQVVNTVVRRSGSTLHWGDRPARRHRRRGARACVCWPSPRRSNARHFDDLSPGYRLMARVMSGGALRCAIWRPITAMRSESAGPERIVDMSADDQRPRLALVHRTSRCPATRLPGDRDADVCIVGAGYTGLWTAYYLKQADPSLRITVLEARFAGFGASGRNGGWLSGLAPGHRALLAKQHGRATGDRLAARPQRRRRRGHRGGGPRGHRRRHRQGRQPGRRPQRAAGAAAARRRSTRTVAGGRRHPRCCRKMKPPNGSTWTAWCWRRSHPHCARVQPAKLARGLADVVERLGVTIYEQTPVTDIRPAGRSRRGDGAGADRPARHRGVHHRGCRVSNGAGCR